MSASMARRLFSMSLMSAFAFAAVLLAALGIYGVMAFLVGQRDQEFGIRQALGATRRDIMTLAFRPGFVLAAQGTIIGVLVALPAARLMSGAPLRRLGPRPDHLHRGTALSSDRRIRRVPGSGAKGDTRGPDRRAARVAAQAAGRGGWRRGPAETILSITSLWEAPCHATPAISSTARSTCSILKTLSWDTMHGYAIAEWIEQRGGGELVIVDAALYKALHRLEDAGSIVSEWGLSDNNRRARYYSLTAHGRAQLRAEAATWKRYAHAVHRILETA